MKSMKLIDLTKNLTESESVRGIRCNGNEAAAQAESTVAVEHLMDVYVNETLTMKLVCSPSALPELVLGRLYSEGIIESTEDVTELYICQYGSRARVMLNRQAQTESSKNFVETSRNLLHGQPCAERCIPLGERTKDRAADSLEPEWFYHAASLIREGTALFNATHGVHSCYLIRGGEMLLFREDLGRHNALDKVIGAALMQEIDLKQCALFSSGRLPTDMVAKAIRAAFPFWRPRAAPTAQGIELAKKYRLTLITGVREDKLTVYKPEK